MYVSKKRKAILEEMSALWGDKWRVGKLGEYPTLFCNDKVITQGEVEVKARIDQLARENGIYID